jgi:outer membrane receptor for ferrienterochelin and colicins
VADFNADFTTHMHLLLLCFTLCQPPQPAPDSLPARGLEAVVVTATRTERQVGALPMPVTVIGQGQIRQSGSVRLGDILREQTGLAIVNDHGQGLQVQGFNPDYTLILVDGEPLVGRTAGTLELSRLTVGNIKQIEIVKGPSSSLYGSEALAGVVNIITGNPGDASPDQTRGSLAARYGANQTSDLAADVALRRGKTGLYLFGNRYQSAGYTLAGSSGPTVAPFLNYTTNGRLTSVLSKTLKLNVSGRYFVENQQNAFVLGDARRVSGEGSLRDFSVNPTLTWQPSEAWKLTARYYHTGYQTRTYLVYEATRAPYDDSFFRQTFSRPELILERTYARRHFLTLGAGYIAESVEATRYPGRQQFTTRYAFAQFEYVPTDRFTLIVGGRYDSHSQYAAQVSPKLSARYELSPTVALRGSAGVGFKAPDFRQLYLNFDNAVAGYSVFGTQQIAAGLTRLQQQGLLAEVLIAPEQLAAIRAESSVAVNLGAVADFQKKHDVPLRLSLNLFRNDVRDLIETQVVARRTNGQNVFSYTNLSEVYTQGFELDGSYRLGLGTSAGSRLGRLTLSAGYQYLEAFDKGVLDQVRAGQVFRRNPETLVSERITTSQYGGLFNRSRHMSNLKLFYELPRRGLSASLRAVHRGRYGFGDRNGNLILDDATEYVPGYVTGHATISKTWKTLTLQAGLDNFTNYTDSQFIPTLPGRLWFASLRWDWTTQSSL